MVATLMVLSSRRTFKEKKREKNAISYVCAVKVNCRYLVPRVHLKSSFLNEQLSPSYWFLPIKFPSVSHLLWLPWLTTQCHVLSSVVKDVWLPHLGCFCNYVWHKFFFRSTRFSLSPYFRVSANFFTLFGHPGLYFSKVSKLAKDSKISCLFYLMKHHFPSGVFRKREIEFIHIKLWMVTVFPLHPIPPPFNTIATLTEHMHL